MIENSISYKINLNGKKLVEKTRKYNENSNKINYQLIPSIKSIEASKKLKNS